MREFDLGTTGYWGNTSDKILNAGNDRFTVRSVKIVADGVLFDLIESFLLGPDTSAKGALRSGGAAVCIPKFYYYIQTIHGLICCSYMNPTRTTHHLEVSSVSDRKF